MKIIVENNADTVSQTACNFLMQKRKESTSKNFVIGLATGSSAVKMYKQMIKQNQQGELDFSNIHTFNLDEYIGLPSAHHQSFRYFMHQQLFNHVNLPLENINFLNGIVDDIQAECDRYENKISDFGGIDVQVLGVGSNGHIAFNEPGTPFDSRTHKIILTEQTKCDNNRFFAEDETVPEFALSMGIETIMECKSIVLIATGKNKAQAVVDMIEGKLDEKCPASVLRNHKDISIICDKDAASKLSKGLQIENSLDPDYKPAYLENVKFEDQAKANGCPIAVAIAVERENNNVSVYKTIIDGSDNGVLEDNLYHIERLVKFMLWQRGGWKITVAGPKELGEAIAKIYSKGAEREFDAEFMGPIYENKFTVCSVPFYECPAEKESSLPLGKNMDGCRIGFDLGASDRKTSAVIDGKAVFSEETPWDPSVNSDPDYHYEGIMHSLKRAIEHLPKLDAIGGSSAGVYVNSQVRAASLFRAISDEDFEKKIKNMFFEIGKEFGVPIEVVNDGDVTALAGGMSLNETNVLGIAMGSSEAVGYIDGTGNITGWLNELAFAPVDYRRSNKVTDEWSNGCGVGANFFSQQAVVRLAKNAKIELDSSLHFAEQLKEVQKLLAKDDPRAIKIFKTIGMYLGHTIPHYAQFYDIKRILILGRVTSGNGGSIILTTANEILRSEYPKCAAKIEVCLPDEASRRVGQAIAAASLPRI
jgi:glucosamine-6-phosphate isomerase